MRQCIQAWLGSRLGIVIDTTPENFGRHTKDGRILAKLLYSYDIIPLEIYNRIKSSKNVNNCYANLKIMKPWLEYLDVPVKDEALYEVASNQGTAALHLFYALYLSLENKDRLFYLSANKERSFSDDCTKRKMQVEWVPEKVVMDTQGQTETDLALPLISNQYMIENHKKKCNEVLNTIRCLRENRTKLMTDAENDFQSTTTRKETCCTMAKGALDAEAIKQDLQSFEDKHVTCLPDLNYQELVELQNQVNSVPQKPVPNFKEAAGYLNSIKLKSKRGIIIQTFQENMQALLVDELWDQLKDKQEDHFEAVVCSNLLKQSQYEKQLCTKLALVRHQKDVLIKNRMMIEGLKTSHLQGEFDDCLIYKMEAMAEDAYDEEFESQRILELHKRMYIEKVRLKLEERVREARSILDKIIDIVIRISEFREMYACEVPKHLMKDLKELFFKDLSIFDIFEDVEELYKVSVCDREDGEDLDDMEDDELGEEEAFDGEIEEDYDVLESEECGEREEYDSAKASEYVRQEVLNECDFNDYMFLLGPWLVELLFGDDIEPEVNQTVLGYIVHKMLACKYPTLKEPVPAEIKPMNPRAIVQGISVMDEPSFNMLKELMALLRIFVVRIDDAINFVLKAYKDELSVVRDVDVSLQQATKTALKGKGGTERTKEPNKKEQLLKREAVKKIEPVEPDFKDVETQTPRRIPEDDPILSPNAEIGKVAFEALGTGDPVPDCTIISAVIARVISVQDDYDGWVLWNYPTLYSQASKLECALTGYQLMDIEDENDTVEGIEGFECRRSCQDPSGRDEYAEKRTSRLVPKFESNKAPPKPESYFTAFIKLRKKSGDPSKASLTQPLNKVDHVEKFYDEQKIFYGFEYSTLSFQTLKDVGKLIVGQVYSSESSDTELVPKPSVEVFGEGVLELNEKYNPPKKKMERDLKKPVDTPKKGRFNPEPVPILQEPEEVIDEGEDRSEDRIEKVSKKPIEAGPKDLRPGDPDWEWATGPLTEEMQLALANFWEGLEAVYIEDFKNIFLCLRVHRSKTIKYKAFLKKSLQSFMKREDDKQVILNEFQLKFNDIDDDLRPDADVKCELYVRVAELEEVLFQIADDRKEKSDSYRVRFVSNNWIIEEMTHLVNLYLRALQLEADRSIDTCQFINDYYYSLQQKVPPDNVLQKSYTPKLVMNNRSHSIVSTISRVPHTVSMASNSPWPKGNRSSLPMKSRRKTDEMAIPPRSVHCGKQNEIQGLPGCAEAVSDILTNLMFPPDGSTPFHHFFMDAGDELKNNVKETIENCIADTKKGERTAGGGGGGGGGKDKKKTADVKVEMNPQLNAEWTTALENELSRFLYRMRLVQMRGILDFNEFLLAILDTLTSLSEEAGDMYRREVASISECCKVFRCAIEAETGIQPRLELNIDEFTINHGVLLYSNPSEDLLTVKIPDIQFRFTIEQLSFIFKKLQYIAPDGEIVRRSFLYILEDFRVMKSEDGVPRLVPNLWDGLSPNDLPILFDHIYQRLEIVNWKDFIIYALELPPPTEIEVLSMRSAFRMFDQTNSELISFEHFKKVIFWFETYGNHDPARTDDLKELLFKMYQVDDNYTNYTPLLMAFCKDEDPVVGFVKALSLAMGKRILIEESSKGMGSEEGEHEEIGEEEDSQTQGSGSSKTYTGDRGGHKCLNCVGYACQCKDPIVYQPIPNFTEEMGEAYSLYIDSRGSVEAAFTSEVPRDILKKVFLASFPAFPQLTILLGCKATFEQTLDSIFESLSIDGTHVKVHKLINHKLAHNLLRSTNKFKMINLLSVVKSIADEKQPQNQSSCSINWT